MIQVLMAFIASLAFSELFNIERTKAILAAIGGGLSWLVYLIVFQYTKSDITSLFMGSFAMSIYSEILARLQKSPATIFYIPGFIPLVPGATVYYSVYEFVIGNSQNGLNNFILALLKSGAITLGLVFAGALVIMIKNFKRKNFIRVFKNQI